MRGELIGVWSETWSEIWAKLSRIPNAPVDLFGELYSELSGSLVTPPDAQTLAELIADEALARRAFQRTRASALGGEVELIEFMESAHDVLVDLGGDRLSNRYFVLTDAFLTKYSLRYDLRRPFALAPTLPGIFATLMRKLRESTRSDTHLDGLMKDFEAAIRGLRSDATDTQIKTCIQKEMNLLEALGRSCPGVTQTTLGRICEELSAWPHAKVKESLKALYGFTNDYPGIRHGGTPANAIRNIEMRDLIALSILLVGFSPYLSDALHVDGIYSAELPA